MCCFFLFLEFCCKILSAIKVSCAGYVVRCIVFWYLAEFWLRKIDMRYDDMVSKWLRCGDLLYIVARFLGFNFLLLCSSPFCLKAWFLSRRLSVQALKKLWASWMPWPKICKMREQGREEREEELEEDQASLKIHSCFHRLRFWLLKGSSRGSSLGI